MGIPVFHYYSYYYTRTDNQSITVYQVYTETGTVHTTVQIRNDTAAAVQCTVVR